MSTLGWKNAFDLAELDPFWVLDPEEWEAEREPQENDVRPYRISAGDMG